MTCTTEKVERMAKKVVREWIAGTRDGWESVDETKKIPELLNDPMKQNLFRADMKLMMSSSGCGDKTWQANWRTLTLSQLVEKIR